MAKKISLKKALLMSGLSMAVCSAMLVGTTFAWFSSTAQSGVNKIVAGNLKVELQYENGTDNWEDASNVELFDTEDVLWEPGMMVVSETIRVANTGTLALQYNLSVNVKDVIVTSTYHGLSEVIQYKVVDAEEVPELGTETDRADVWDIEAYDEVAGVLEAGESTDALKVVLYWEPTDHDNDYNIDYDNDNTYDVFDHSMITDPLKTEFSVSVYATQASVDSEKDSFGSEYDKETTKPTDTVIETVTNGVGLMNDAMAEGGYASLSDLEWDEEQGAYVSTVTMDGEKADDVTIYDVYEDIAGILLSEVIAKSDIIYSIAITTNDIPVYAGATVVNAGEEIDGIDLIAAIYMGTLAHFDLSYQESKKAPISGLEGYTLKVIITTMDGEVVQYNLPFVIGD